MTEDVQPIRKKIELEVELNTSTKETSVNRFQPLLDFSEVLDAYRIFPRAFISVYMYLLIETVKWFMLIPVPNASQAGLISVVVGAGAAWFGLYTSTSSGRSAKKNSSS
jgi:N12 class adenine-specific DNA methylase